MLTSWISAVWEVIVLSSFWLLIGFVAAGLVKSFFSVSLVERHIRKRGLESILKAAGVGVPLPLCSCSVIPVAVSLRKKGASPGATASFLISTPEIGVDSFLLSYGLLGPLLATLRAVAAFFSAMTVGVLIDRLGGNYQAMEITAGECCAGHANHHAKADAESASFIVKLMAGLRWSFTELVDDIAPSLILGFVLAGIIAIYFPADLIRSGQVSYSMLLLTMLVVSMPLYVCASSSTPLALSLLHQGVSPGAVLVFLLVGPATNIATMLVVRKEFGLRGLCLYVGGLAATSLLFAVMVDHFWGTAIIEQAKSIASHNHTHEIGILPTLVLLALLGASVWRRFRSFTSETSAHG